MENGSNIDNEAKPTLSNTFSVKDFLTVLALSCHTIFEGLAIGLEKHTEEVWALFAGKLI